MQKKEWSFRWRHATRKVFQLDCHGKVMAPTLTFCLISNWKKPTICFDLENLHLLDAESAAIQLRHYTPVIRHECDEHLTEIGKRQEEAERSR